VENGTTLAGAAIAPVGISPRKAASQLYDELFGIIGDRHLWRVWNYIPRINDIVGGEENYREFNAGRLASFQKHYGAEFRSRLCAASALGTRGGAFALAFLAGPEKPVHFENPEQVPACDYPADYGPLPPAFARGTRVGNQWFLAGTASIKGHNTLGDTCAEQMRLTLDNIRVMERTMSLPQKHDSAWKVFVRHESDIATCREMFAAAYPDAAANTMFLHADICRSGLLVEIEAVFSA
jgi:chorismate lyase/3-hydroxybenzoate synthase